MSASERIDVLAVMDEAGIAFNAIGRVLRAEQLSEARAAVAELIEAVRSAKFARVDYDAGPAMFEITEDDLLRISGALARVQGEPHGH